MTQPQSEADSDPRLDPGLDPRLDPMRAWLASRSHHERLTRIRPHGGSIPYRGSRPGPLTAAPLVVPWWQVRHGRYLLDESKVRAAQEAMRQQVSQNIAYTTYSETGEVVEAAFTAKEAGREVAEIEGEGYTVRQTPPAYFFQVQAAGISSRHDGCYDGHQRASEGIRGHQRVSVAICGHPWPSVAIRGHPCPSVAISGHQWSSVIISGHQWPSVAISGHQWPSVAISGHPWPSVAISGHQWPSVDIDGLTVAIGAHHNLPSSAIICHHRSPSSEPIIGAHMLAGISEA